MVFVEYRLYDDILNAHKMPLDIFVMMMESTSVENKISIFE